MDARTWTAGADLFNAAEAKLREAGLPDLAETVATVCNDFGCCTDDELRELQDRVAEEAGKLEATYLEMGL
jgi:hypothetical protein